MRVVYVTDQGCGSLSIVASPEGLILRGGELDVRWQPSDCIWMPPTWQPPTPEPEE